jgi:hypothetical protein
MHFRQSGFTQLAQLLQETALLSVWNLRSDMELPRGRAERKHAIK